MLGLRQVEVGREACQVCRKVQLVLAVPIKRKVTSQKRRVQAQHHRILPASHF